MTSKFGKLSSWFGRLQDVIGRRNRARAVWISVLQLVDALNEAFIVALFVPITQVVLSENVSSHGFVGFVAEKLGTQDRTTIILGLSAILMTIVVFRFAMKLTSNLAKARFVNRLRVEIAERTLRRLLSVDYQTHISTDSAKHAQLILRESSEVAGIVGDLMALSASASLVVCLVAVAAFIDPKSTAIAGATVGLVGGCAYLAVSRQMSWIGKEALLTRQKMASLASKAVWSYRESIVFGTRASVVGEFATLGGRLRALYVKTQMLRMVPIATAEFLFGAVIACGLAFYAFAEGDGVSSLPQLVALVFASLRILPRIMEIVGTLARIKLDTASMDAIHASNALGTGDIGPSQVPIAQSEPLVRGIDVKDVSIGYGQSAAPVLSHVNALIPAGKLTGVFGPSGAGKTTFLNAILGFLPPTQGVVEVDGNHVATDLQAWHAKIGLVPQDPVLFGTSIRDNIVMGRKLTGESERLREVLSDVRLEEFVATLERGLDTEVGERGVMMSGGQRQRIAIARALYAKPAVLVLDEPNSSVEPGVAAAIDDALERLRGRSTILLVSHRLVSISKCDQILFFQKGALEMSGTFDRLMTHPRFAEEVRAAKVQNRAEAG